MTFDQLNLSASISKAIALCGYTTPTAIQSRSIPEVLNGKDLVASAQTGTGKTAAFVLPALQRLSLTKSSQPRVLILTPTRELATQITDAISKYGKFLPIKVASLLGGMPYRQQLRNLSRPVDIIVATPGRLLDHMNNKRINLSAIEMLILDEADRMLDMGFIDDVREIAKSTPNTRQTLLFSATINDRLSHLINNLLKNPVRINISPEKMSPQKIEQKLYYTDNAQHKTRLLQHFLTNENIFKAIIFSATKLNADDLAGQLIKQGFEAAPLHGDLKQAVRNRTIERLRRGKIQYLIATDVAARGIDVKDITHVINYDLPRFSEDYVHRIGRTGRAGKSGIAISFASPADMRHLQKIERYVGHKLEVATIEGLEPTKKAGNSKQQKFSRNKSFGDKKNFSGKKSGGYKTNFSEKKGFGKRSRFSEKKDPDNGTSFSEKKGHARKNSYSEKKSFSTQNEGKLMPRKPRDNKRFGEKGPISKRGSHAKNRAH